MPVWLIVVIAILCFIAIIGFIYMILAFRRITIFAKKMDYLIEDITYKSEKMNDVVDAIVKVSKYINVAETLVKSNADVISDLLEKKTKQQDKFKNEEVK